MRTFAQVLVNTALANVTTSYLWFGLTFWVYLETRSVLATGIVGGAYMLFVALFGMVFGTIVDRHRKHQAMIFASSVTLVAFLIAGGIYLAIPESELVQLGNPMFWVFGGVILFGGVIENMRNIALSTTVTLLVPQEKHANANGFVGTVQGLAFLVTSVFSGLSIGLLGMGWTLLIAIVFTALALIHLLFLRIPEDQPKVSDKAPLRRLPRCDHGDQVLAGTFRAHHLLHVQQPHRRRLHGAHGPYGLELFAGRDLGDRARRDVGRLHHRRAAGREVRARTQSDPHSAHPRDRDGGARRDLHHPRVLVAVRRRHPALHALIPAMEAAEQTVIQKVVPFETQGRVFGFAQAFEAAAAPITAFVVAPIADRVIIPYMNSQAGKDAWGWLLGDGRGPRHRARVPLRRTHHGGRGDRRVLHPLVPQALRAVRRQHHVGEAGGGGDPGQG